MQRMILSITNGYNYIYVSVMPHYKGTQRIDAVREAFFQNLRHAHSYYDIKYLKESPYDGDETSTKAAVRFVFGENSPTYVTQLEKTLDVWQLVTLYDHHPMDSNWTWEESQMT